jgi:RNA polymerase sigma-70 factor, ECF subfamily
VGDDRPGLENDADVIAASMDDPVRFGEIFDRHATVLHRYLVRRLGPDDADGMVGEVFRIGFERRHTFDLDQPSARPWLYGIATNLLKKHHRTEARRLRAMARLAALRFPQGDPADQVATAVDAADLWEQVAIAVEGLPELERDALLLHVWEGLSYEEVADALGIPIGTVRSRLHRARVGLRELAASSGRQPVKTTEKTAKIES